MDRIIRQELKRLAIEYRLVIVAGNIKLTEVYISVIRQLLK